MTTNREAERTRENLEALERETVKKQEKITTLQMLLSQQMSRTVSATKEASCLLAEKSVCEEEYELEKELRHYAESTVMALHRKLRQQDNLHLMHDDELILMEIQIKRLQQKNKRLEQKLLPGTKSRSKRKPSVQASYPSSASTLSSHSQDKKQQDKIPMAEMDSENVVSMADSTTLDARCASSESFYEPSSPPLPIGQVRLTARHYSNQGNV